MSIIAAKQPKSRYFAKRIAVTAMLSALSTILMFISFPLPMLIPSFVKMDFSELPALVASFVVSPVAGVAVCFVKNLINAMFTTTAGAGELCNFLLGAAMVLPAGIIYQRKKTRKSAVIACIAGSVSMALLSLPINYYISYPVYSQLLAPMDAILDAYRAINPGVKNLWDALVWFNMPFTFLKAAAVSGITFMVYKPLSNALKRFWS